MARRVRKSTPPRRDSANPGFLTEHLEHHDEHNDDSVIQHYTSTFAMDVTPGTTEGTGIRLFDGTERTAPAEEFYVEGEPGMIARFCNPDGDERIDVPLDGDTELVVVRWREGESPSRNAPSTWTSNGSSTTRRSTSVATPFRVSESSPGSC